MGIDRDLIGVGLGLAMAGWYGVREYRSKGDLEKADGMNAVLVFLFGFLLPDVVNLVRITAVGQKDDLPERWRELVGAACVAILWLGSKGVIRAFKSASAKSGQAESPASTPAASAPPATSPPVPPSDPAPTDS